ncbi:MAG: TetR family transcriptional regulator [Actinocatenispora sp.]
MSGIQSRRDQRGEVTVAGQGTRRDAPGPVRRPRDRRQQIAAAAGRLFHESGFHGVGIAEIAACVGVGGSAVYRHFRGKQDLLAHLVFTGLSGIDEALDQAEAAAPVEQFDVLLAALSRLAAEHREFAALWQLESRHLAGADHTRFRRHLRGIGSRVATILQESGPELPDADADLLAWAVMAVCASPSYHRIVLPGQRLRALVGSMARTAVVTWQPSGQSRHTETAPVPLTERASRREMLLAAAARLFRERGFQSVGMEDIGTAAGIAGPSVYRHFASKADLLSAALTRATEWLSMSLSRALGAAASPAVAIETLMRSYVDFAFHHTDLLAVLIGETANLPEPQRDQVRRARSDYVREWRSLLVAGRPTLSAGEAHVLVHGAHGIVNDLALTPRFRARPRLSDELTGLALRVLLEA